MILNPGAMLSALAGRLSPRAGRAHRRQWVADGRAHIEVKGAQRPENAGVMGLLEDELCRLEGVHWVEVNGVVGRVVVAFDDDQVSADDLIDVVEGIEEAHGLDAERVALAAIGGSIGVGQSAATPE